MNFSFLNPLALWALPLSLAPIVLHFFFRRPPKVIDFGDLKLLTRVAEKTRPHKKIKQWLVLLLRFLSLFCLFFFFSKPILHWGSMSGEGDSASVVILLDHSYSMRANPVGFSRWDQALRDAQKVLNSLKESDRSSLIVFSEQIDYDSGGLTNRHEDLIAALKTQKPGFGNTQTLSALEQAYKTLANSAVSNKCILILTDGARHGWLNAAKAGVEELKDWSALVSHFDPSVKILMSEPSRNMNNASIENVEMVSDVSSGLAKYRVTLQNWGTKPFARWPVSLERMDGSKMTETLVDLLPGERKSLMMSAALPDGQAAVKAVARPDSLEADDSFFMVQNPLKRVKVLVVEDYAGTAAISGETFFFRQAIKSGPSPFEVQTITLGQLKKTSLNDHQVVFLADPSEIDRDSSESLKRFVNSGGSLFLSLGERYQPETLNEIADLLPCTLEGKREVQGLALKPSQNLAEDQLDVGQYESEKIEVRKAVRAVLRPESSAWLYFSDGAPLLVFSKDQKVAVWASSIDRSWNNFASKPLYAPLMRSILNALAQKTSESRDHGLRVGEVYQKEFSNPVPQNSLVFENSRGERIPLTVKDRKAVSPPLTEPGFYSLSEKLVSLKLLERVSVNVDRRKSEGNLAPLSVGDGEKILPKSRWIYLRNGDHFMDDFIRVLRGKDLTRVFAMIAGLFLICEMALIYRNT